MHNRIQDQGGTFGMAGISTTVNEATAWKIQGNINYKQGNFEYALIFYENGLKSDPHNVDILNNKGMALVKLGRVDEARQCQRAIRKIKEKQSGMTPEGAGKPGSCTVKIKGMNGTAGDPGTIAVPATSGFIDKALMGELQIGDIERNIALIQKGLEKVRLCRLKETKDCKLRIKEMEENIETDEAGARDGKTEQDRGGQKDTVHRRKP